MTIGDVIVITLATGNKEAGSRPMEERGEEEHLDGIGALLQRMVETRNIAEIEGMVHQLLASPSPPPSSLFRHAAIRRFIGEGIVHPVQTVRYLALRLPSSS